MDRRAVTLGAAITAAFLAVAVVFLIHNGGGKPRRAAGTPPATSTTAPVLTFAPPSSVPIRTLPTAPPTRPSGAVDALPASGPPITYSTLRGEPPVSWTLSGSCHASGDAFSCHVAVSASNGLESGGFVAVYLKSRYGQACGERAPVSHGSVTLTGECGFHPLPTVEAVYSLTPVASPDSNLATAPLPLS
jgi:hypothetical protein